jgi:DNA-directed RNA polymerase specialized sigma24 family protein
MRRNWKLTQEAFDGLLAWLSPDREEAGRKYEEIRRTLVKIFTSRGCQTAEELADETINRVIDKLPEVAANYVGNKALYFYGIAKKVLLESLKNKSTHPPPPAPETGADNDQENRHQCLERCLNRLDDTDRTLVIDYYSGDKRAKIEHRKALAVHFGLSDNALKIKMCRLRAKLYECVRDCLKG